jgi:glyoxylase-like metal-dependent hydrolase (beta-lactamase superfamily II)
MKRRSLLTLLMSFSLLAAPVAAQDADSPPPVEASHITGALHQLRCNGNVGVIASIGEDGTLLVDTGYAGTAEAVQQTLAELGGDPARIIINTHGDGDHVGGNAVLGDKAVIIAHPYVREQVGRYFALPAVDDAGSPNVTVTEETAVHFNGEDIRLIPIPGGHTAGDLVVHFTESRVACIGDLILVGSFPNASPARGGDARRLIEVLNLLHETLPADTTVVAAHGGAISMADLEAYAEMVEGTFEAVEAEVKAGRSLQEIVESDPLTPWQEWQNPDVGISSEDWTREIHAGLTGASQRSICVPMTEALVAGGVDEAVGLYRRLEAEEPESWSFAEEELNMLGYQLLARERIEDAIVILELNVEAYPEAFNTYDSLGEAFMAAGKTEESIANYERSLELNPENANAVTMLARLRGE